MTDSAISWHDKIAKRFEQRYVDGKLFRDRFQVWSHFLKKYCDSKTARALDLGCGAGNYSLRLAEKCERLVCVDGSQEMARLCREKLSSASLKNYEVVVSDIDAYCTSSVELFDIICCSSVLEYVDDIDKTLSAINSRLDEGGTFLFTIPNADSVYRNFEKAVFGLTKKPSYYRYVKNVLSLTDVTKLLSRNKLECLQFEYLTDAPYIGSALNVLGEKRSKSLIFVACRRKPGG